MKTRSAFYFEQQFKLREAGGLTAQVAPQHAQVHRLPKMESFVVSTLATGTGTPPPDTPAASEWLFPPESGVSES